MPDAGWNRDLFASELKAALDAALDGPARTDRLEEALARCAEAAEDICRDRPMACGAGCPHCCVLNVAVLLPEAMRIAAWLRRVLAADGFEPLRRRLAEHGATVRWMDDEERIFGGAECPFLDGGGSCSIHPVRPLSCRGVASLDRESCRAAFRPRSVDQERLVPADLLRRGAFDVAFTALGEALRRRGLDDRSIELGRGVLAFCENPGYGELYLSGGCLPRELWE